MNEIKRITDLFRRAYNGDPWYGYSLKEILQDVTSEEALLRTKSSVHNIWEIILHISFWIEAVIIMVGKKDISMLPEGDWPAAEDSGEEAWLKTLDKLDIRHGILINQLERLCDQDLDEIIGKERNRSLGTGLSLYTTLHGLIQHNIYHAGQISLIKKQLRK